jgi:hypothetical protein
MSSTGSWRDVIGQHQSIYIRHYTVAIVASSKIGPEPEKSENSSCNFDSDRSLFSDISQEKSGVQSINPQYRTSQHRWYQICIRTCNTCNTAGLVACAMDQAGSSAALCLRIPMATSSDRTIITEMQEVCYPCRHELDTQPSCVRRECLLFLPVVRALRLQVDGKERECPGHLQWGCATGKCKYSHSLATAKSAS